MTDRVRFRPFTGDAERKVRIPDAPLALVLAQIRWPEHGRFARDFKSLALDFGDRLDDFPLYNEITESGIQITPEGVTPIQGDNAHQWRTIDDVWTINLTKNFVSIYCIQHENYGFSELQQYTNLVADLLESTLNVRSIDRIGLRYVNRISNSSVLEELGTIFSSAVLGYAQLEVLPDVTSVSNISQGAYQVEEVLLQARSGMLAPGQTVDPAIPSVNRPSWVLDIDASIEKRRVFDPEDFESAIGKLADTAYDFFKLVLREGGEDRLDGSA
ncbi:TIGR04255 family protein [Kocuria salina]|uniref:TIGR04255 family protein n=1 Tax=Kocuria salina TaxID=1929416 RepID=UPI00159359EC|nr:TIGR04255 family protein [Kocuria salina]NVC25304.1 TIGR04255 family protein [Kocuria salina]